MPWHESESTPLPSVLPLARLPSIFERRHLLTDRQDLEHRAEPELREGLCGFVGRVTNCLVKHKLNSA